MAALGAIRTKFSVFDRPFERALGDLCEGSGSESACERMHILLWRERFRFPLLTSSARKPPFRKRVQ